MKCASLLCAAAVLVLVPAMPAAATAPPAASAAVAGDGTLVRGVGVAGASHTGTGTYTITLTNEDMASTCGYSASTGPTAPGLPTPGLVNVAAGPGGTTAIWTYDIHRQPADMAFEIYVAC